MIERSRGILPGAGKFHRLLSAPPCRVNRYAAEVRRCIRWLTFEIRERKKTSNASALGGVARFAMHGVSSRGVKLRTVPFDPRVGDIEQNAALITAAIARADRDGVDLIVFSELALIGYPPRDLLFRDGVAQRAKDALLHIASAAQRVTALVGFPEPIHERDRPCANAIAVLSHGRVRAIYRKRLLPEYDVFAEERYFIHGESPLVFECASTRVGVLVCEDLWRAQDALARCVYDTDPVAETLAQHAQLLVVPSASPFAIEKDAAHREILARAAARGVTVVSVNQAGAHDDLLFDGHARIVRSDGELLLDEQWSARGAEHTIDLASAPPIAATHRAWEAEVFLALTTGIEGYFRKTGHSRAVLGLSGGIDSALVAALAARALGGANVTALLLPSRYSSPHSLDDARASAHALGLADALRVPINDAHDALRDALAPALPDVAGIVDENLQSRIRGVLLMAYSNATGSLVLTTGNKSEHATGFATLYGDMCGALAPIGDLTKTRVYALARWMNANFRECGFTAPPIPLRSIEKAPSAELRADQTDQDTLPAYRDLDAIVEGFVEHERAPQDIAAATGLDLALVTRWCTAIDRAQFKRDQAAVILKLTQRAFGRGRPFPIVSKA